MEYPQGDGFARMDIGKTGVVSITGKLGEGTAFTSSSLLKDDHSLALYAGLYASKPAQRGSVAGRVSVGPAAAIDLAATLRWYKPPQTSGAFYRSGFATEFTLGGSPYSIARGVSVLGLLGGNGQCVFDRGNLAAPFGLALAVTSADKVTTPPPNTRLFSLAISRGTGSSAGASTSRVQPERRFPAASRACCCRTATKRADLSSARTRAARFASRRERILRKRERYTVISRT